MSLVNNVLRDLDRRRAADSERGSIPNEVRPLPEAQRPMVHPAIVVTALVAILAAAGAWWWMRAEGNEAPAGRAPAHSASVAAAVTQGAAAPATVIETPPSAPTSAVVEAPVPAPAIPSAPAIEPSVAPVAPAVPVAAGDSRGDRPADTTKSAARPRGESDVAPAVSPPGRLKMAGELALQTAPGQARAPSPTAKVAETIPTAPAPAKDDDWKQAQSMLSEGRPERAEPILKRILISQPAHVAARNALVGILLPAKRNAEAREVLKDGLDLRPDESGWAINLARLHAIGNDYPAAWDVLERSLPHAEANAEYRAFCGTVLQRLNRGGEALAHYLVALKLNPREPRWWVGMGIALESAARVPEAREAYSRAQTLGGLSPELASFVAQKLK